MFQIKPVECDADLSSACDIISRSQKAESKSSGVLYNTHGLKPNQLKEKLASMQGTCYCAYDSSEPAGTLSVFQEENHPWYAKNAVHKTIKYVAVSPEHQGKHIATEMLEYIKSSVEYDVLSVSTGENNKHALHLYTRCGFVLVNVSRGPIHNAYKLAYWKNGCPFKPITIKKHIFLSYVKSFLKKLVRHP